MRAILAVAVAASLTVSGCSMDGAKSVYGTGPDAVLRVNAGEPQSPLIPTDTNENMGGRMIDALFTGLFDYAPSGDLVLANAESVETTDNQNFTVKLKRDWTFHDGTPVKAHNYVKAWNFGAATVNLQKQQYFFEPIEGYDQVADKGATATEMSGLRVVDDYTFTVRLKAPSSDFKLSLGHSPFKPLPDVFFTEGKEKFGQQPIGNGPYKFKQWRHNVQLDVTRNDEFKGTKPKNGGLAFVMYESYDAAYVDLQSGNLDVLDTIPNSGLRSYQSILGSRAQIRPVAVTETVVIGNYLDHFSGEEGRLRRQAISMAIDRGAITDKVFRGTRNPALDFTARAIPGWRGDLPGNDTVKYNPERAKQLWAQANAIRPWSGQFQIAYNSDGDHKQWADAVSNQVKNTLGIDASGRPYATFKQIRDEITKRTIRTAARSGWQGDYPSQLNFLVSKYTTGASSNDGDYSNPAFDLLITQAQAAADQTASRDLIARAQEILLNELPAIPLWDRSQPAGTGAGVKAELTWNGLFDYVGAEKR
ncbi:ABC transporter substrate-binding protein [Tsukamurella serpentis]